MANAAPLLRPGGALPHDALNYVDRKADAQSRGILEAARAPSSVVIAPINGGMSSFFNRVYQRAKELRYWTCLVSFDTAFPAGTKFNQLDLFRYLLRKLEMPEGMLLNNDIEGMKAAFEAWAPDAWSDLDYVVLIIDGLDKIVATGLTEVLPMMNWFAALRGEAALGEPPFSKLIIFTSLVGNFWSAAHGSPWPSHTTELWLNKFSPKEIAILFERLELDTTASLVPEAHKLFHGHPFLTQLFAWSLREGLSPVQARHSALALEGSYGTHWERMTTEIRNLVHGTEYSLARVLAITWQAVEDPTFVSNKTIWNLYHRHLQIFGLIDGSKAQPTLCDFYRRAITVELEAQVGEDQE